MAAYGSMNRKTAFVLILVLTEYSLQVRGVITAKFGILYDSSTIEIASLVHGTVNQLNDTDVKYEATKVLQSQYSNLTETLLNLKITAVLAVATHLDCAKVRTVKKLLPIFSVAKSIDSCDRDEAFSSITYLFPSNFALMSALVAAAQKYEWTKAIVLEKQSDEIFFSFTDMQYTREQGIEIVAYEANNNEASLISTLQIARKEGVRAYILTSPTIKAKEILQTAQRMQLTTENFHWFLPNVFYDPDSFSDIAKSGVAMTFLSSSVITPLVKGLLRGYSNTSVNVTSKLLYNDVIKALARLAVDRVSSACRSRSCHVDKKQFCRPQMKDVDFDTLATSNNHAVGSRRRRDNAEANSLATSPAVCASGPQQDPSCRQMSKFIVRQSKRGGIEERRHFVTTENRIAVKTRETSRRATAGGRFRREADALSSPSCTMFQWPAHLVLNLFGNTSAPGLSSTAADLPLLRYISMIGACSTHTPYIWAYANETCSRSFVESAELRRANTILISEYLQRNYSSTPEPPVAVVGTFEWNHLTLNVTYRPFSVNDVKLPHRVQQVCAIWVELTSFHYKIVLVGRCCQRDWQGQIKHPPWLSWKNDEETGEQVFEGYLYDVLKQLSTSMNFTFEIVIHSYFATEDRPNEEELERAIYAMFDNDSCDFFLHTKGIRGGRLGISGVVDLSLAYQQPSMFLLTKRSEKTESIDIWQFMTPFHEESWIYLWTCFILISLFLAFINYNNPYEYQKIATSFGPDSTPGDHLGVLNSLWFTFSSIVQQGVNLVPRSRAAKTLTASWWFFGLTIITAYTANMTLFMTQVNKAGIETLDELANQKEFGYGIMYDNPMLSLFLPDAKERPYTQLYNHFKRKWNDTVFRSHREAFDKILSGDFLLMASFETTVEALTRSCDFDKVGSGFYKYQFALPFPKGSLVVPLFNDHIARLRDRGILATLEEKWFSLERQCESSDISKTLENQLDIKAFTGMYVFLIIGCSIGGLICLLETGWIRYGGISGMFGRARQYEFQENRRENRKGLDHLATEFEKWEGGWEVWKFKEWVNDRNPNSMPDQEKSKRWMMEKKIQEITRREAHPSCDLCGKIIRPKRTTKAAYRCNIINVSEPAKISGSENIGSGRCSAANDNEDFALSSHENESAGVAVPAVLPLMPNQQDDRVKDDNSQKEQTIRQHTPRVETLRRFMNDSRPSLKSTLSHSSLASGTISVATDSSSCWTTSHYSEALEYTSDADGQPICPGNGLESILPPPVAFSKRGSLDDVIDVSIITDDDEWTDDDEYI